MSKTIEETYKKLSQREHILHRPGMYIGDIKKTIEEMWVFDKTENKMVKRIVEYSPGFLKIFDEVLTNATDHATRDSTVNMIKVEFNKDDGEITIWNNGMGIPVVEHKEHKMYVPELIFGHFLSGSNYNDKAQRTGAGMNGLGIKAVSCFSRRFIVETVDSDTGKKFIQEYTNNMSEKSKPKITKNSGKSYTKISFIPDYARFSMKGLDDDTISLITKRVYDCIACTEAAVGIYLNGERLKGKGLQDYIKYFFEDTTKIFYENATREINGTIFNWEYAIIPWEQFEHVSFVNGNSTYQGGKHVDHIMYQVADKLKQLLASKKKVKDVKAGMIKDKMFLFLRSTIINPQFNSQTKELLTTQVKDFGCKIDITDKFIDKIWRSNIILEIVELCKVKESIELAKKTDGTKRNRLYIPKLEDALWAGTSKSDECTLILTEGDSAKTFALWGRSVYGPEKYGVYSLKGKVLNVRDATIQQLVENEEINNIKQIVGLKQNQEYKDTKDLRYGRIIILTDADSVTYDTPCILKHKITNEIEIKPISEINDNIWQFDVFTCKEYNNCDEYLVWSDNGWTEIVSVMRHKVNKPIHRVITSTGSVDVTEDHSLLNNDGDEITVKDCKINETKLLHKKLVYNLPIDNKYNINEEYAWALGYIQAAGHIYPKNNFFINSDTKEPLRKLQSILYKNYVERQVEFKISKMLHKGKNVKYILELYGDRKDFCIRFRKMFYNSLNEKKIPIEILNNTIKIQEMFLNGFYNGKDVKNNTNTKTETCGLFQLLQNCGYNPSLDLTTEKLNIYSEICNDDTIKKIINVSEKYKETYVYDFETKNHHFHSSIGNIIVHNCDGSHIKGLFVNFIHTYWPSLLKINPNFIQTVKTPIVKAIKGKTILEFFTEQDYLKWKISTPNYKSYHIRYFKGLGTSKKEDAKETFQRIKELTVDYYHKDDNCDKSILLAFDKDKNIKHKKDIEIEKCSDKRKQWLSTYDKNSYIQLDENRVSYSDLINKELIHFSIYDNARSIPSLCDGLKPSQRKILFYMLKNNITKPIKVAQLSGYVSAETGYHHGEVSLNQAIINMAQNFIGSNNLNLIYPDGNFGSRLLSKDAASPRYIFTRLENYTVDIFNQCDNPLLTYLNDDGMEIEPEYYVPILPMILVNGCSGIGTGYSTSIPSYNPLDVIVNLKRLLENKKLIKMMPYFKGFAGNIEEITENNYITKGKWEKLSNKQIKITELPVGMWVTTYKEFLETLIEDGKKKDKETKQSKQKIVLKDVQNKTRDENTGICFIIEFKNADDLAKLIETNTLEKELKLIKSFNTTNMYLFNQNLILTKYKTPLDIIYDFYNIRIDYYQQRKNYMIKKLQQEFNLLDAKRRFIKEYMDGTLDINRRSKNDIIEMLKNKKYPTFEDDYTYEYLLRIQIGNLSFEKITELESQLKNKEVELKYYTKTPKEELWKTDLDNLLKKLKN